MKDQMNRINPRQSIAPQVQTNTSAAIVGAIIDRLGFEALTYLLVFGAITDANMTFTVTIDHGDDPALADAATVPADQLVGTFALAAGDFNSDNACRKVGYTGYKRYTRLTITSVGNDAGAFPVAAIALLGHPNQQPTANPPV